MRTVRVLPIAITALLVLTACDPGAGASPSGSVGTSPAPVATPSPSPSVTPAPPLDPHPPLADLRITTHGLVPLLTTEDIAGNPGEAMLEWDELFCYSVDMGIVTDTGRWKATYPDTPFLVDGEDDDWVHRIDIISPVIATPKGIHIGSTLADVQAAYPGLVTGTAAFSTTPYWIADADGFVVFEVGTGTVMGDPGPEQVWYIRSLGAGSDPDYAVASSGNVAGACF